ncbi:MAG: NIPSNAP family protein [Verrucomicrobiales bacterium]|nr:NIPSNAP family protein [Verrucomicrobiales bacterium]
MKPFSISIFALSLLLLGSVSAGEELKFFELRTYHTHPGKLDALHARFRDHTCKLFTKHGMSNTGYWTPKDKPDTLIYLLGYPDENARKTSWTAFRNDPDWQAAYQASTADGKLITKVDSLFLQPTDYSKMPALKKSATDQLYELRIYTTNEGKLDDLHARFRDHTCELFEKHGISNFAYFTPTEAKDGAETKLVYLVSHKDESSRSEAFKAFTQDPAWKSAKGNSEKAGPILVKKGVSSTFLLPTDYSPVN